MTGRIGLIAFIAIFAACSERGAPDGQDLAAGQPDAAASCQDDGGTSCTQAPAALCIGDKQLQTYVTPGVCDAETGRCTYTGIVEDCPLGCSSGACSGSTLPLCMSGLCVTPPEPICERETFTVYGPMGTCDSTNHCHYPTTQEKCSFPFVCAQHRCAST